MQRTLTHLFLHVHNRAAGLYLDAIIKEFVSIMAERTATFGLFLTISPAQCPLVAPAVRLADLR